MMRRTVVLSLLLLSQTASAQPPAWAQTFDTMRVTLSVDKRSLGIAERLTLSVALETEYGGEPRVEMPDQDRYLGAFLVTERQTVGPIRLAGARRRWQHELSLQAEQAGRLTIPALAIEFGTPTQTVLTQPIAVTVTSVVPEDALVTKPRDIAAPVLPPAPAALTFGNGLLALLAGLLLALLLGRYIGRQRRAPAAPGALEAALAALDELQPQALDYAHSQAFYTRLSTILRRYLEAQFALPALRQTSAELLAAAAASDSPIAQHQRVLRPVLTQCDLAKFAGQRAHPRLMRRALQDVRAVIQQTAAAPGANR